LFGSAKKPPVQEQVEDEQGGEQQARVIVYGYPLVAGDTQIGSPPAASPSAFRKNEIQDKPGDEGRDERNQAADINNCVEGYASHGKSS
jgi:hypothetical protein